MRYDIVNAKGEIVEGGFFTRSGAESMRDHEWPGCSIVESRRPGEKPKGRYSGLTAAELRASGTCETDWY